MSDTGNDPPDAPDHHAADDIFAAAGRRPSAPASEEVASVPIAPPPPDDEAEPDEQPPITSAQSPFPDGAGAAGEAPGPAPDEAPGARVPARQYRPPRPGSFGYHTPPPSGPDGEGGYRAGAYPAGPPMPTQPQFGRRAPQRGPQPNADGFYPSEYYLGTDWTRVVVGGLASTVLILGLVVAGMYLFDRFDPRDDDDTVAVATPTAEVLIPVFACAGDADKVTDMPAPQSFLITGRDGGNRWLAFRNPQSGRRQLWIRASSVPTFDPTTVGVVSCASSDTEFPTPLSGPTPSAASTPSGEGDGGPTPTPVATPTP